MVKVYHNGAWYPLSGNKIYRDGTWITLKDLDLLRYGGVWYYLGDIGAEDYEQDSAGWFPAGIRLDSYLCDADVDYDPGTGDPVFSNYRWELMSTDYGVRSPGLDPGIEYPQWRWYTVGEQGNNWDFSIEVNPSTGQIVGPGDGLYNGRMTLPEPGYDWYMESVTVISIA